jgi:DNA-binding GntR family transcriptional regulator
MSTISEGVLKRTCMRDRIRDVLDSRIPIREALRELEGSGLVSSERFRGTRVRGADSAEMRESYELRTMLEVRSVKLAAPYSDKLLADFAEYLVEMDAAVKADDSERYIDAALRFHRRLVEGSQNRTFLSVWDSLLWDVRGRIALRRMAERGRSLHSLAAAHRELLLRLQVQDSAGAAQQVQDILARVSSAFEPE